MPPITALCMDLAMAGLAQCNEVISCMGTAFSQRFHVVDFLRLHKLTGLKAYLAQRVLTYIAVTDALPCTTIATMRCRVTVILLIALGFLLCVFLTEPPLSKPRTAGVRTRSFRLTWHTVTSS